VQDRHASAACQQQQQNPLISRSPHEGRELGTEAKVAVDVDLNHASGRPTRLAHTADVLGEVAKRPVKRARPMSV
jgi:hypothetical protein